MADREDDQPARSDYDPPSEATPLLSGNDLPSAVAPDAAYQRKVVLLCMLFFVVVLLGHSLQQPPQQQLLEWVICREFHPELTLGNGNDGGGGGIGGGNGDLCSEDKLVQGKLAMIWGWNNALATIPPLFATIPYGILADKYGRRPILFFAMLGLFLQLTWVQIPLHWPDFFPVWTIWFSSLFTFIGGGVAVVTPMIWTMVADVIPVTHRTTVFFQINTIALLTMMVVGPISALLMGFSPWVPMLAGTGLLFAGILVTMFIPETLELRQAADDRIERAIHGPRLLAESDDEDEHDEGDSDKMSLPQRLLFSVRNDFTHVWRFLISTPGVVVLLFAFNLSVVITYAKLELFLQYVHQRYGWTWQEATFITTIGSIANVILYVAILPGLGYIFTERMGKPALVKDLWLLRIEGVVSVFGCLFIALSPTRWALVGSLIIFSLGNGYSALCRAIMNAIVEPHTIATLNTCVSVLEMICMLVAAPGLSALLRTGINAGGAWAGLPYMAAAATAVIACVMVFMYRLPRSALPRATA